MQSSNGKIESNRIVFFTGESPITTTYALFSPPPRLSVCLCLSVSAWRQNAFRQLAGHAHSVECMFFIDNKRRYLQWRQFAAII